MKTPLLLAALALAACQSAPPAPGPARATAPGLPTADPRGWYTYPAVLLVATKYHLGVDTVARVLQHYNAHLQGVPGAEAQRGGLPLYLPPAAAQAVSVQTDQAFFQEQGRQCGAPAATVAAMLTDFYLLARPPSPE